MDFTEKTIQGVPFGCADFFAPGAVHGFSTRLGGVSEGVLSSLNLGTNRGDDPARVSENWSRFCAALGAEQESLVFARQVHGDTVRVCTRADRGAGLLHPAEYAADALVTDVPGLALAVFSADCIPVLLYDPVRAVVAAIHAGWRGTALGVVERAVQHMMGHYGCDSADIQAAVGPGISKCCFETREDVPNAMTEALGAGSLHYIEMMPQGKFRVDLKGLNAYRLERVGVRAANIAVSPDCTACLGDKYWSHRVMGEDRGSMAAVIQLTRD